ncbi:MAG: ABC transporter permease [Agathobaculum sp.]|jgi:putative ABC transport system permease protein|uniref:ABC transporter permease n=1 Tax=Agathobaculum sp. TaxID=2048138 RepID=UPI003D8FD7CD
MRVGDLFRLAGANLRVNPVRTLLCALSVAVGTGALLLISSIGLFGRSQVEAGLQTIGVGGLSVYLDGAGTEGALSVAAADAMEQAVAAVERAMPVKAKTGSVRVGHTTENAVFVGADGRMGQVMQFEVMAGTLLTQHQAESARQVAVIGDDLAETLYGRANVVGQKMHIRLNGAEQVFTVCGVVRSQTGAFGGVLSAVAPHLVYLPYPCLAGQQDRADQIFVRCAADADLTAVSGQITRYFSRRGPISGTVRVQNISGMVDTVRHMADLSSTLFLLIGVITLCVALIGVLCSMLAATYEKTEEIGVFLALGAQPRDIRRLFLLQSLLICAVGGGSGLMTAGAVLYFGASLLLPGWGYCIALLLLSAVCGAGAGLMPAVYAARLDPVAAMSK